MLDLKPQLSIQQVNDTVPGTVPKIPGPNLALLSDSLGEAAYWGSPGSYSYPAPGPSDTGKLAIASSSSLSYALLTDANVDPTAAIATAKLAHGAANEVLTTNAAGSAVQSRKIVAANVDPAAAIPGTYILPDFGALDVVTTGSYTVGPNAASAGAIRLFAAAKITFRAFSGGSYFQAVQGPTTSDNSIIFGDPLGGNTGFQGYLGISMLVGSGGGSGGGGQRYMTLGGGLISVGVPTLLFEVSVSSPTVRQGDLSGFATANTIYLRGQKNVTGDSVTLIGTGGTAFVKGGECTAANGSTGGLGLAQGGDATGAGGTRTGGDAGCQPGSGASANGEAWLKNYAGTKIVRCNDTGLAFYGGTPVAQAVRAGQLADSTGGTVSGTIAAAPGGYTASNFNDIIASLVAKINALELVIHNLRLTA